MIPLRVVPHLNAGLRSSHIVEKGHKTEIHVQLLMAVEQGEPWVVGNEIHGDFLVASDHEHIFNCGVPENINFIRSNSLIELGIHHRVTETRRRT
jgi:hypothetical protein